MEDCLHSDVHDLSHTYQVLKQLMQTQSILDRKGLALSISLLLLSLPVSVPLLGYLWVPLVGWLGHPNGLKGLLS